MKIAFVLFDSATCLDFIGFYDVVTRIKTMHIDESVEWQLVGLHERVCDDRGLQITLDLVKPDLHTYDLLFVPGGIGTRTLRHNPEFVAWLRTAADVPLLVSVCTGSLLLGAAGFLQGRRATTHPNALDLLEEYVGEVVRERIVQDGKVITGAGVSTSIDLGLYLCEQIAGKEAVQRVCQQMDYPYYPGSQKLTKLA